MSASDESDKDDSGSERRLGGRHLACFPAYVKRDDGKTRTAMIRDLSATGALLVVRAGVKVGDVVQLSLFINGDVNDSKDVGARVVRVEDVDDPYAGPWSARIAVQFDDEVADVLPEIARLAAYQAGDRK